MRKEPALTDSVTSRFDNHPGKCVSSSFQYLGSVIPLHKVQVRVAPSTIFRQVCVCVFFFFLILFRNFLFSKKALAWYSLIFLSVIN